jgi:hypothetical protein
MSRKRNSAKSARNVSRNVRSSSRRSNTRSSTAASRRASVAQHSPVARRAQEVRNAGMSRSQFLRGAGVAAAGLGAAGLGLGGVARAHKLRFGFIQPEIPPLQI